MKIIWSPLAIDRISEIAEYISQDNPSASVKWIDDILLTVRHFKQILPSEEIS